METDEYCPICLEEYDRDTKQMDGIQNSDYESNCIHWACVACWQKIYRLRNVDDYCPICKRNITDWLKTHYETDDDESDDDQSESDNDEIDDNYSATGFVSGYTISAT